MDKTKTAEASAAPVDFLARVPVKDLKRAFALAKMVSDNRSVIPVLSRAKLSLNQELLRVEATDIDNELTVTICTDAAGAGTVMAPIFEMTKILGCLPRTGVCVVEARGAEAIVTAGDSTWNLACYIPPSDYPAFPVRELPMTLQAGADVLRNILDNTLYAVSTEETRYYLNGVSLSARTSNQGTKLRAVTTDGHRMAALDVEVRGLNIPTCILPTKAARMLREIIKKDTGSVWLAFAEDGLTLQARTFDAELRCKMIDGTFPDVESHVLSKIAPTSIATVDAAALGAAIRRVTACCDKVLHQAVRLSFEADGVDLSGKSHDVSALERVPLSYTPAPPDGRRETGPFVLGLNYRFAIQALDRISGDVRIEFQGPGDPVRLSSPTDPAAFSVLMPMRVE